MPSRGRLPGGTDARGGIMAPLVRRVVVRAVPFPLDLAPTWWMRTLRVPPLLTVPTRDGPSRRGD
jgi:hypothetical protein